MDTTNETNIRTRIYAEDSVEVTAQKIFDGFILGQSCTIEGWTDTAGLSKGQAVLDRLTRLDRTNNMRQQGKKMARTYIYPKDSVGGSLAHKIFRYKKIPKFDEVVYQIWRMQ